MSTAEMDGGFQFCMKGQHGLRLTKAGQPTVTPECPNRQQLTLMLTPSLYGTFSP